jgi:hypothetical protein
MGVSWSDPAAESSEGRSTGDGDLGNENAVGDKTRTSSAIESAMDIRTKWKVGAIAVLVIVGLAGWLVPLESAHVEVPPAGHLPLDAMFRSAGVVIWRLLPFAAVLQIFSTSGPRRRRRR